MLEASTYTQYTRLSIQSDTKHCTTKKSTPCAHSLPPHNFNATHSLPSSFRYFTSIFCCLFSHLYFFSSSFYSQFLSCLIFWRTKMVRKKNRYTKDWPPSPLRAVVRAQFSIYCCFRIFFFFLFSAGRFVFTIYLFFVLHHQIHTQRFKTKWITIKCIYICFNAPTEWILSSIGNK